MDILTLIELTLASGPGAVVYAERLPSNPQDETQEYRVTRVNGVEPKEA